MDGYYPLNNHFRVPTVPRVLTDSHMDSGLSWRNPTTWNCEKNVPRFRDMISLSWWFFAVTSMKHPIFRENPQHLLVQHHLPYRICQGFPYHWTKPRMRGFTQKIRRTIRQLGYQFLSKAGEDESMNHPQLLLTNWNWENTWSKLCQVVKILK